MNIHDLKDREGRVFAFEVDTSHLSRSGAIKVAQSIPGVRIVKRSRRFSLFKEEDVCEFDLEGQKFKIWEPFADSNRYWIGPEPVRWCEQLAFVREAFLHHNRFGVRRG